MVFIIRAVFAICAIAIHSSDIWIPLISPSKTLNTKHLRIQLYHGKVWKIDQKNWALITKMAMTWVQSIYFILKLYVFLHVFQLDNKSWCIKKIKLCLFMKVKLSLQVVKVQNQFSFWLKMKKKVMLQQQTYAAVLWYLVNVLFSTFSTPRR